MNPLRKFNGKVIILGRGFIGAKRLYLTDVGTQATMSAQAQGASCVGLARAPAPHTSSFSPFGKEDQEHDRYRDYCEYLIH